MDRIGRNQFIYENGMNDSTSNIFKHYEIPIKEALDRTLMQSDLRDIYRNIKIVNFIKKPTEKVIFNL